MSRPIPLDEMVRLFKSRHTTSHMFKIDNFSLLKKYHVKPFDSSAFNLGGHKWKLSVHPNGYKKSTLAIFLGNQAPINVHLEYELFVVSQLEPNWYSQGKTDFGTPSTSMMKGILINKSLAALETEGYLIGDCLMVGVKLHGIAPAKSGTAESFSLIEKPLNHKVTWMMTRFSSFDPDQSHYSNEFVVGNRKWRIEVHPRGFEEGKDESFSVYLLGEGFTNNSPRKKTIAKFKLRVLDQFNRNHIEKTYWGGIGEGAPDNHQGFSEFMPLEKLDEPYLVKDKLYVGVEFEVISVSNYC